LKEAQASLAFNLKAFLDKMRYKAEKIDLEKQTTLSIKRIDSKEEAHAIGRVLKNRLLLDILLLADGTRNTTEIAKQLGKHLANVSTAISELKHLGLVSNGSGSIHRTQQSIAINLQCGLR
jgi:predicted transcriptional regulator